MSYSHAAFIFSIRQQVRLLCLVGSHGRLLSVAASLTIPHCSCNNFWMLQADSLLYCFAYNKKFNKKTVDRPVPSVLHGSSYCSCVYRLSVCMRGLHRREAGPIWRTRPFPWDLVIMLFQTLGCNLASQSRVHCFTST